MRVLNVVNGLVLGGIETMLLHAIPHLQESGIEIDLCCHAPPDVLDHEFEKHGCHIWRIPKKANCSATAKHFQDILKQQQYSLIHSHFGYTSGGLALGAARMDVPIIVSFHNCRPMALSHWRSKPVLSSLRDLWLRWHRSLLEEHADQFVGHSQTNISAFNPKWQEESLRHRILINGIEFPKESLKEKQHARKTLSLPSSVPVILHVGSFTEKKNHKGLLQIFSRVNKKKPKAILLLVGDGPLSTSIEKEAENLNLREQIRFEGSHRKIWDYFTASDVFLFPSHDEGFGNVLVESTYAKLPIVASDISAHRESVPVSQHPFLFPLPDYNLAAELVLKQLSAASQSANNWVATSEGHARTHFSMERYSSDLTRIYHEIAHKAA